MGGQDTAPTRRRTCTKGTNQSRQHRRSLTSNITNNVTGLTSNITSSIASNLASNLTGRPTPSQTFNEHNNKAPTVTRRGSFDCRFDLSSLQSSSLGGTGPLTMNHLLKGKTALTSKTKRVVARGLVAVPPPATNKKVSVVI